MSNLFLFVVAFTVVLLAVTTTALDIAPELRQNQLEFPWGANFKYNGMLNHNLDRVWIVTKVHLPQYKELLFPQWKYYENCDYLTSKSDKSGAKIEKLRRDPQSPRTLQQRYYQTRAFYKLICAMHMPLVSLIRKKEIYYQGRVRQLLTNDIAYALEHSNGTITKRSLTAVLPLLGKLAVLAVEGLSSYLQQKRNKAMAQGLEALSFDQNQRALNRLYQYRDEFLMYGQYNAENLEAVVQTINDLGNKTSRLERAMSGQEHWPSLDISGAMGPSMFISEMQVLIQTLRERHNSIYEELIQVLEDLVVAVATLSKGYLPPQLFPPSRLKAISERALQVVKRKNPDYVLAVPHLTHYYDMKLVTFGVDPDGDLIVTFPIFVQSYHNEPMILYEIETVQVPIKDENLAANSYSQVMIPKLYLAVTNDYYIQLRLQELRMCKHIRHVYYCEELFLVKHKSKFSCASALYYHLPPSIIMTNCEFKYDYNITVMPSVLDGGDQIVLANMLSSKRLICADSSNLARPFPDHEYVLVNRSILCHCKLDADLMYLLKSVGSCQTTTDNTVYFTINLAFYYDWSALPNVTIPEMPLLPVTTEVGFPLSLHPALDSHGSPLLVQPRNLHALMKMLKNDTSESGFSFSNGHIRPNLPNFPVGFPKKPTFFGQHKVQLFVFIATIASLLLCIPLGILLVKHQKMKLLVGTLALWRQSTQGVAHALPVGAEALSAFDAPTSDEAKLVCQDPWVSLLVTIITIVGILVYIYKNCRRLELLRGFKYHNHCDLYLFLCHDCYYVPLKVRQTDGHLHMFTMTSPLCPNSVTLQKHLAWDVLHIEWHNVRILQGEQTVALPRSLTVPLTDKLRVRRIFSEPHKSFYMMVKQGNNWYYITPTNTVSNPAVTCNSE